MMKIRAEMTDLWADAGGWSGNYSWVRRVEIELPDNATDLQIARRVKKALGIQGMRQDHWAANEFCWREGCVGAWAEVVS
jgi:hypothetical protein